MRRLKFAIMMWINIPMVDISLFLFKSNYTTSNCTLLSIASVRWLVATKNELLTSLHTKEEPALGNGQTYPLRCRLPQSSRRLDLDALLLSCTLSIGCKAETRENTKEMNTINKFVVVPKTAGFRLNG